MNRGRLDTLVIVELPSTARNGAGEQITEYDEYARVYASVANKSGNEGEEADQKVYSATRLLTMDYGKGGINTTMRLQFNGQYWDILDVFEKQRGRYYEVTARSKDNS